MKSSGDRAKFDPIGGLRNHNATEMENVYKMYIGKITGSHGWEVENEKQ
jgi:hypothetical protein